MALSYTHGRVFEDCCRPSIARGPGTVFTAATDVVSMLGLELIHKFHIKDTLQAIITQHSATRYIVRGCITCIILYSRMDGIIIYTHYS